MDRRIRAPRPRYAEMRQAAGYSQMKAAELLGFSARALAGYELGTNQPTAGRIVRMAEVYGCTTDALLGLEKE